MSAVTQHIIDRGDGARVELFQARPSAPKNGAILFVHGNQGGLLLGGKEAADGGSLVRFSSRLGVTAAAVSQPGFGESDGPADFCGPTTQQAIVAALEFLKQQPSVDPARIVLYGNSRGAVASAMVATKVQGLRALILTGGVYDLREAYESSSRLATGHPERGRSFERKLLGSVRTPSFGQDSSGNLTSPRQVR